MNLLPFQEVCIERISAYMHQVRRWSFEAPGLPNIPQTAWDCLEHEDHVRPYCSVKDSDGNSIPCASIVIPTGGGKTITALAAGIAAARTLGEGLTFLVWMVPSEAIFTQTRRYLTDGYLVEFARSKGFGGINLKTIGETWTDLDFDDSILTVLLVSQQSILGDRSDLHFNRISDSLSTLTMWSKTDVEPSLRNLLRIVKPIFVIDECHRTYTETGRAFFRDNSLSSAILEFSATPKDYSHSEYPNVLHSVPASELIQEELLKNPLVCHFDANQTAEELIKDAVRDRRRLEKLLQKENFYAKPKFLISCRRTSEKFASDPLSVQKIRELLLENGVDESCIAVKSSELDDLGEIDVDSPTCQFEFILTQRALVEGWDAKTVFGVVLLNEIGAHLTNFQIIGRGLRQPGRSYFKKKDLNAVHVYSNSDKQDSALKKLAAFLQDEGLSSGLSVTTVSDSAALLKAELSKHRIELPAIELQVSREYISALASRELSAAPPVHLTSSELLALLGIAERSTAVIDISGVGQATPMVTNHISRAVIPNMIWERKFMAHTIRSLRKFFYTSDDCISWVKYQAEIFSGSEDYDDLRKLEPSRISMVIESLILHEFDSHFHEIMLKKLNSSVVQKIEICGDLINPVFAVPDQLGTQPFSNSLIGDVPKALFNSEELEFARYVDSLGVKWVRNQPGRGWYSVPGGSNHRFYPDFLIFRTDSDARDFDFVVGVETKGSHLIDNLDSQRKSQICSAVTAVFGGQIQLIFDSFENARVRLASLVG